jgi:hypothetical protein
VIEEGSSRESWEEESSGEEKELGGVGLGEGETNKEEVH